MKIADPDSIKMGEKDLVDSITADLDWDSIEEILLEKHKFRLQEDVEYKSGDLLVFENQIAYKLDFDIKVSLSVVFNRNGECLKMTTSGDVGQEIGPETEPSLPSADTGEEPRKQAAEMASNLADMMNDINKE